DSAPVINEIRGCRTYHRIGVRSHPRPAQSRAARCRHPRRRAAAHPGRRGLGEDARAHAPRRLSDPRPRRLDTIDPGRHLYDQGVSERIFSPAAIGAVSSGAKNELTRPADMASVPRNQLDRIASLVWQRYDALLRENNAVDFDDLLLLVCRLFETSDLALEKWQERYQHILVRSEEHTSELQSRVDLVCRLLLEKK